MSAATFPARVHILIARNSSDAVVIRRGPARKTCIIGWDRKQNTFTVGQWLKGRIYERRSDIAPPGKHWIYFAMNGHWDSETKGIWTAIARTPYLKALDLMGKGNTYFGGGLFIDDHTYWLNDAHRSLKTSGIFKQGTPDVNLRHYGSECLSVYYPRLERDGWIMRSTTLGETKYEGTLFEKELLEGWKLIKVCHSGSSFDSPDGKGCYWDEHILTSANGVIIAKPDWEWADWVDDSITYVEQGCLYQIEIVDSDQLGEAKLLHDFNGYKFEAIMAPY
ncbi:MAG: hypothetical protein K0U86_13970 [Planctomycetes bacterium]|nr:hypothetical protein [Planctomycetota bacterium]MCH9726001.1 hypothetical protein [Planctomycetota bacterium]MCH9777154.1 hypothetical protein [Planctomycetota bacterium]MCH9790865.1 hypothetical protein [Planctomycetota bacterium]